jgi:hypothetical protein
MHSPARLVLTAMLVVAAGCSKNESAGTSATASATAAPPPVVSLATEINPKFGGDYDHALYVTRKTGGASLTLARGCPSYDCDSVDAYGNASDATKKSCASAGFIIADFTDRGDGKAGDNVITLSFGIVGETGTLTGMKPQPKLTISDLGADTVTGVFDLKNDNGFAKGPFKAKVCPKD